MFNPQIWSAATSKAMKETLNLVRRPCNSVIDYTKFTKGAKANGYNGPFLGDVKAFDMPITAEKFQQLSKNNINFMFDQKKGVPVAISDIDSAQHILDERKEYAGKAKEALLDVYDKFIIDSIIAASPVSNRLTKADTTGNKISANDFRNARKVLNKAKAPLSNRYAFINADDEGDVSDIDQFIRNEDLPKGTILREGMVGRAFGFDIILYNPMEMVNSSGLQSGTRDKNINLFFQKNCFGWGRQKEFGAKAESKAGSAEDWLNTYSVFGGTKHQTGFIVSIRDNVISGG